MPSNDIVVDEDRHHIIAGCGDKSSIIRIIIKPTNYKCVGFGQDFLDDGPREVQSVYNSLFQKGPDHSGNNLRLSIDNAIFSTQCGKT